MYSVYDKLFINKSKLINFLSFFFSTIRKEFEIESVIISNRVYLSGRYRPFSRRK